jgi:hypothetical protein
LLLPDIQPRLDHGRKNRIVVDNIVARQVQAPQLTKLKQHYVDIDVDNSMIPVLYTVYSVHLQCTGTVVWFLQC